MGKGNKTLIWWKKCPNCGLVYSYDLESECPRCKKKPLEKTKNETSKRKYAERQHFKNTEGWANITVTTFKEGKDYSFILIENEHGHRIPIGIETLDKIIEWLASLEIWK